MVAPVPARALPLLLEQAAQLGAGQVHHHQGIPEREHGLGLAEVTTSARGARLEVLADAARFMKPICAPWARVAASTASAIRSPSGDSPASFALRATRRADLRHRPGQRGAAARA
jgi:hypothetical protein